jgi:hypothetical protein
MQSVFTSVIRSTARMPSRVNFVLQKLRRILLVARLHLMPFGARILITDSDCAVPFHLHKDGKKTPTSVPDDDPLLTALDNFRIH